MLYAEVAVDAPLMAGQTLTYAVPSRLRDVVGQLVWVPLGKRIVQGIVFSTSRTTSVHDVREILEVLGNYPLISSLTLELSRWISNNYMSSLFEAAVMFFPPGFRSRVRTSFVIGDNVTESYLHTLTPIENSVIRYLESKAGATETQIKKLLGKSGIRALQQLETKRLVNRERLLPSPRTVPLYSNTVVSVIDEVSNGYVEPELKKTAPKQAKMLHYLSDHDKSHDAQLLRKTFGSSVVNTLIRKGLVCLEWKRVENQRDFPMVDGVPFTLTSQQKDAVSEIILQLTSESKTKKPFLLYGVTGSGKTEIYIRALLRTIKAGKQAILLVPEISLTPQMVFRLNERFPGRVVVLHSKLSLKEKFDSWWRINRGEYDIVVGPRSALFAPLKKTGLIILDEEHEWTYKQQDKPPRYHARDVALRMAELTGSTVILGSATPDITSFYKATIGEYRLMCLPNRVPIKSSNILKMGALPTVKVVDMRRELRSGNRSIFSEELCQQLNRCISLGERAILFLNRRGSATVVMCRSCGYVLTCPRCSVAMAYHTSLQAHLRCHHCNYRASRPSKCPDCESGYVKYLGVGTQMVLSEINKLFPGVSAVRWDSDAALSITEQHRVIKDLESGKSQVLVGTQMIAKGLHVPSVTLVGVILADIGLSLHDFRAGEKTFQLLCQVVGRSGRGAKQGVAVLQTYNPNSYVIQSAARQDFQSMYQREIKFRNEQKLPPFTKIVRLIYLNPDKSASELEAKRFANILRKRLQSQLEFDYDLTGPAPGMPELINGRYRWQLLLRGENPVWILKDVSIPRGWIVDVDPVSVN